MVGRWSGERPSERVGELKRDGVRRLLDAGDEVVDQLIGQVDVAITGQDPAFVDEVSLIAAVLRANRSSSAGPGRS
jgi:hypothetical protein